MAGTEKQHVADDYAERLSIGTMESHAAVTELVSKLLTTGTTDEVAAPLPTFEYCQFLNVSVCTPLAALASGQSVPVVAYNPIAWDRTEYFRLPVPIFNVEGNFFFSFFSCFFFFFSLSSLFVLFFFLLFLVTDISHFFILRIVVLASGQTVPSQVHSNGDNKNIFTLAFAVPVPAMSFVSFVVQPRRSSSSFVPAVPVSEVHISFRSYGIT